MKEKLLSFFAKKGIYVTIASIIVCGIAIVSSVVVVHNNNKKLDTAIKSIAAMSSSEENTTDGAMETNSEDANTYVDNTEPSGDKALLYIKEYDKLTADYEAKKEKLVGQTSSPNFSKVCETIIFDDSYDGVTPDTIKKLKEKSDYNYSVWESESASAAEAQAKADTAKKQLDELTKQYKKDVAALKAKYGI